MMKAMIVSVAALGLIAAPAIAKPSSTTTKTMTTKAKGGTATATTTVTTKVTPTPTKMQASAKRHHGKAHSKVATAQATHKPAKPAKKG